MCGIVGMFNTTPHGIRTGGAKILRDLAFADTVRGVDGVGYFTYRAKGGKYKEEGVYMSKGEGVPQTFLTKSAWEDKLNDSRFAVIHNRAATSGGVSEDTAHPFTYGGVTGVHNGTIHSWRNALSKHLDPSVTMDSMAVIKALSETEPDMEAVGTLLGKIESGAYSLVWYDERVNELRFARNISRPMNFVVSEGGVFFGSELRMVEWVLDRHECKIDRSCSLDIHTVVGIDVATGEATSHSFRPPTYTRTTSSGYSSGYAYHNPWDAFGDVMEDTTVGKSHGTTSYGSRAPYYGGAYNPRSVVVSTTDMLALPTHIDAVAQTRISVGLQTMLGIQSLNGKELCEYQLDAEMAKKFDARVLDAKVDLENNITLAPVRVPYYDDRGNMYGYVLVGEEPELVSIARAYEPAAMKKIREIIDGGHVAVIPDMRFCGVKIYYCGYMAYKTHVVTAQEQDIHSGTSIKSIYPGLGAVCEFAGRVHPDNLEFLAPTVNWNEGWRTVS